MLGGISLGLNKRRKVLFLGLSGKSLERASWSVELLVSCVVVIDADGGTVGTLLCLVSEPSELREILSNSKGSTEDCICCAIATTL